MDDASFSNTSGMTRSATRGVAANTPWSAPDSCAWVMPYGSLGGGVKVMGK
jgi:hypothetical protein